MRAGSGSLIGVTLRYVVVVLLVLAATACSGGTRDEQTMIRTTSASTATAVSPSPAAYPTVATTPTQALEQRANRAKVYYRNYHPLSLFGRCKGPGLHLGRSSQYFQYTDLGGGRHRSFFTFSIREDPHVTLPAPGMAMKILVARPDGKVDRGWTFVPSNFTFVSLTYPYDFTPIGTQVARMKPLRTGIYTVLVETLSGDQADCTGFVDLPPKP